MTCRYATIVLPLVVMGYVVGVWVERIYPGVPVPVSWSSSAPTTAGEVFARAGEWVTDERDNHICRLTRNLARSEVANAEGWCDQWTITPPRNGTPVTGSWVRGTRLGGLQLRVEGVWR